MAKSKKTEGAQFVRYSIALHLVDSWKYQAEPESPWYLAFRSEPDFRRLNQDNSGRE